MVPEGPLPSSAELLCASGRATGSKRPASCFLECRLGGAPQQPPASCWSSWVLPRGVVGELPASSTSSAWLLSCHRCLAVPLLVFGARSHHVPPALLV